MVNVARLLLLVGLFLFTGNIFASVKDFALVKKEVSKDYAKVIAVLDGVSVNTNPYSVVHARIVLQDELNNGFRQETLPLNNSPPQEMGTNKSNI